jgi:hypothetical protein
MEILGYLIGIALLVCHILICVKMIQSGQTALGIVCLIVWLCACIGFLITLIYGWTKAKQWNITTLMIVYTVVFVGYIGFSGARYNETRAQIEKIFQKEGK